MLETLQPILSPQAVIAIASNKQSKISHDAYRRVEKFKVGKRQVVLSQPSV
jgi:hypothetical protein